MKITFPHFGDYYVIFRTLFETLGHEVIVPPPISRRTIELGSRHSPEFVCFPFKVTLGCLIEGLEQGADTLFQGGGRGGACRFGYYREVQEKILRDLGYQFTFLRLGAVKEVMSLANNGGGLNLLKALKLGWAKLNLIDSFHGKVRRLSAYELTQGESRRVYKEFLNACDEAKSAKYLKRVEREFRDRFSQIKKVSGLKPVKIGIVGEIYVVMEPYSNAEIERELNLMRVEVLRPVSLSYLMKELLPLSPKKTTHKWVSRPYLQYDSGAHANTSVSETILFAREGLDGVIHLKPHACMPEVTAMSALHRVSRDYNIPLLYFSFDEHTSSVGVKTRLEAFVELIKRRRQAKYNKPHSL